MNRLAQKNATDLSRLSADIQALREKYENKIKEYEALMDLKIQLDQEIATYRALLQEEENRFETAWNYGIERFSPCLSAPG